MWARSSRTSGRTSSCSMPIRSPTSAIHGRLPTCMSRATEWRGERNLELGIRNLECVNGFQIPNSEFLIRTAPEQLRRPWPLRTCGLVLAVRDSGFRRGKAGSAVGAVAEGLGRGTATPAQHEWPLRNRVGISVPVHHRDVVTFHEVRTVLSDLDCCHNTSRLAYFLQRLQDLL